MRRAAIAAAGRMLAETPAIWLRPQQRVAALVREVEGMEAAHAARAQGKALLFLTPHMGCFEVAAQYAAQHMPITVLYRAPKIGWLEPLMREGRGRGDVRLVPADLRGVRELFAALKRARGGRLPARPGAGRGRGRMGRLLRPARLHRDARAEARAARRHRLLSRLRASACRAARATPSRCGLSRGARRTKRRPALLNRALEELVRECPEQYLWGYNRYKIPARREAEARMSRLVFAFMWLVHLLPLARSGAHRRGDRRDCCSG